MLAANSNQESNKAVGGIPNPLASCRVRLIKVTEFRSQLTTLTLRLRFHVMSTPLHPPAHQTMVRRVIDEIRSDRDGVDTTYKVRRLMAKSLAGTDYYKGPLGTVPGILA